MNEPIQGTCVNFFKWGLSKPLFSTEAGQDGYIQCTDHDIERRYSQLDPLIMHITSPGMMDHLQFKIWNDKNPLSNITLQEASSWSATVVDSKTGHGISGAEIRLHDPKKSRKLHSRFIVTNKLRASTDHTGLFSLPGIVFKNRKVKYIVTAEDYLPAKINPEKYHQVIELTKSDQTLPCYALDESNKSHLVDCLIEFQNGYSTSTDASGLFYLPASVGELHEKRSLVAYSNKNPLDKWLCILMPGFSIQGSEPTTLPFNKIIQSKQAFRVQDIWGNPLLGTEVRCTLDNEFYSCFTDLHGEAVLVFNIVSPMETRLSLNHTECNHLVDLLRLDGSTENQVLEYTVIPGSSIQNIHIRYDSGEPASNEYFILVIKYPDGRKCESVLLTDKEGRLNFTVPSNPFKKGLIYKRDDMGCQLNFDHEQVFSGEKITLVMPRTPGTHNTITGKVCDQFGNPMSEVEIYLREFKKNLFIPIQQESGPNVNVLN